MTSSGAQQSKGTKPKRPSRRRRSAIYGQHNYRQAQQARRTAIAAQRRRFETLKRAPHTTRDHTLAGPPTIRTRLIREATAVVDHDPDLLDWVAERINADHIRPGRPRELTIRTALICFILHARIHKHFHLSHLPELLTTMSWRVRRNLGIDYLRNGTPTQVSYGQLLDLFHDLADAFDAWDETLCDLPDDEERAVRERRAADLQELVDRLLAASTAQAPMWGGEVCLDATLKWSHERPPGKLNGKVARRGKDGDAGPAVSLSEVLGGTMHDDPDDTPFAPSDPVEVVADTVTQRHRRGARWPSTWSLGSGWVGRPNVAKAVHGVALHALVRAGNGEPCLVETFAVTPAKGDPADAVLPLLRRVRDRRANDPAIAEAAERGEVQILGDVIADPGYTMAGAARWYLPVKALGGVPVGRLHRNNQDGPRFHTVGRGKRAGEVLTIAGRPMCECVMQTPLPDLRFPKFPYTSGQLAAYQRQITGLEAFAWRPNGSTKADGKRSWLAPHGGRGADGEEGGCEHCVTPDGPAIADDGRPVQRCCTTRSRLIPAEVTAYDIGVPYGHDDWYGRWNTRNRVEGTFGVLKNLAVVNWGRSYHHFVGLARETIVAVFATVAYNAHMLAQWRARQQLVDPDPEPEPFGPAPEAQPVETMPGANTARAESRRAKPQGPKGLEFLGDPGPPE